MGFKRIDRLRLTALLLWALPVVALLPLGLFWLWRSGTLFWWLAALLVCSAAGYGLQSWLLRRASCPRLRSARQVSEEFEQPAA